jgi:DNA-directed RNA polymerase III subunit RPC1
MGTTGWIRDVWRATHNRLSSFAHGAMREYANYYRCYLLQWLTCLQSVGSQKSPGLLPYEIADFVDHELSLPAFGEECSVTYITTIRAFVEQHVITPLAIVRKYRGLPDGLKRGLKRGPDEYSQGKLSLGSARSLHLEPPMFTIGIDNTAKVTQEQLQTFLAACRAKFVKAKIEPGTSLLLVAVHH